ncbi:MAG: MlaD family protein [Acidobacteriota bacterium]
MKLEMKVGIFITLALVILAYLIIKVGSITFLIQKEGYELYATFSSIAGLEKRASVKLAGIKIGSVEDISLKGGAAEVRMKINKEVKIRKGSKATVSSLGMMGEKYIEIFPGPPAAPFVESGSYLEGIQPLSVDQLGQTFYSIGEDLKSLGETFKEAILTERGGNRLQMILQDIQVFTGVLKEISTENRTLLKETVYDSRMVVSRLNDAVENFSKILNSVSSQMESLIKENRGDLKESIKNLKEISDRTKSMMNDIDSIINNINSNDSTIGRLIKDREMYGRLKDNLDQLKISLEKTDDVISQFDFPDFKLGIRAEYLNRDILGRGYFSIFINPRGNRFFVGEILKNPWENKIKFSAEGGIKTGDFGFRTGFIESEFGFGLDYSLWNGNIKFTLESFDFNRRPRPVYRFSTKFSIGKNLFIVGGYEDFALKAKRQVFFGLGVGEK